MQWRVEAALDAALAFLAAIGAEIVVIGRASVALIADYAWFTFAFAGWITLCAQRAVSMTCAIDAFVRRLASIERVFAILAVRAVCIADTFDAIAAVASLIVQGLVEHAFIREAIAIAC